MRKQILSAESIRETVPAPSRLDVTSIATALISSEADGHPVEHAFDAKHGPGGTRWLAGEDGEQSLILAFDSPQKFRQVVLEVEETKVSRTQELQLALSSDGGKTYRELVRQEFNFSPPNTTFEREHWQVDAQGVTHLRLVIKPDKGGQPCRASLTSLALVAG